MAWRYMAQRALSNEWLHRDLPIDVTELSWDLNGPGALRGAVAPEFASMRDSDDRLLLEPWGTYIYAVDDSDSIRWGGIVQPPASFSGATWNVEAAGFTSYPHGVPFLNKIRGRDLDPAVVFRQIWDDLQGYPEGNLGVEVDDLTTDARIGTDDPYLLAWWEAKDSGSELDDLAEDGGFEYVEEHSWDGEDVTHRVRLAAPRFGRKRDDLAFIQGDNVVSLVEPEGWEDFANEVFGLGAGEGRKSRRTRAPIRDGRLRRPIVYTDKGERNERRLDRRARRRLDQHRPSLEVDRITVRDHPNARIGSWSVGDDVLVQAALPWVGDVEIWHRITSWALKSDSTAELTLARSDSFTYGG